MNFAIIMASFPQSLLTLVNIKDRFLWVGVGLSGSSSDGQMFYHFKLKQKIEKATLGLPPPKPLGQEGDALNYFLLGDDALALKPCLVKPRRSSRRQVTREERIANCRNSRGRRALENAFGILESRFRVLQGKIEERPMIVRDIVLTCCLAKHAENTPW